MDPVGPFHRLGWTTLDWQRHGDSRVALGFWWGRRWYVFNLVYPMFVVYILSPEFKKDPYEAEVKSIWWKCHTCLLNTSGRWKCSAVVFFSFWNFESYMANWFSSVQRATLSGDPRCAAANCLWVSRLASTLNLDVPMERSQPKKSFTE